MKSVNLSALQIRPIPHENSVVACTCCRDAQARWEFASGAEIANHFVCSMCFLYRVPAVREQEDGLNSVIDSVEQLLKTRFDREPDGTLRLVEDADRIAYGLVMAQRYEQQRGLR